MHKVAFETLKMFALIMLLVFKSVLLKTIPEFGSLGINVMLTILPECNPIPFIEIGDEVIIDTRTSEYVKKI